MATTSEYERGKIIAMHQAGHKSNRQISEYVGKDQCTVDRIVQCYKKTGHENTNYSNCGCPRVTTKRIDRKLLNLSKVDPKASFRDLAQQFAADYGITLDSSTVRRRLLEFDRKAFRPIQCPVLTAAMRRRGINGPVLMSIGALKIGNVSCSRMRYRSRFNQSKVNMWDAQVVRQKAPAHFAARFRHPVKVMISECMSIQSTGRIHVVEGSMNKERCWNIEFCHKQMTGGERNNGSFSNIWLPATLPSCARSFWKLSMWMSFHGLETAQTSMLSRTCGMCWKKINRQGARDKNDIIHQCLKILVKNDEMSDLCIRLVECMPRRIKACMAVKGGPLKY